MGDPILPTDAVCGCDCKCMRPLTKGNVMEEEVFPLPESPPWETGDVPFDPNAEKGSDAKIFLLLCIQCYTGEHVPLSQGDPA